MVEERCNSQDTYNLCMNILEVHCNIHNWLQDKLITVSASLLDVPASTKYHYWLSLFLDPQYVMELKYIKNSHQSKYVDTKTIVLKIIPKLYDYIMASEIAFSPSNPQILVGNNKECLYFNNNPNFRHYL